MTDTFSNFNPRICDLCHSTQSKIILDLKGRVLRTNNTIVYSRLKKLECSRCGLIRSGIVWNQQKLKKHYTQEYGNHFDTSENSVFFTKFGSEDRSTAVARWISEILKSIDLSSIQSIVEIGSGMGSLVSKLMKEYPNKKVIGFDVNEIAVTTGVKRGLDIRLMNSIPELPKVDLIICYAVIEHTSSPTEFLKSIVKLLKPNGYVILGQPQQDKFSSDIFYQDHLYHFSTGHIRDLGRKQNLIEIKKSMGKGSLSNFSLHLLRLSEKPLSCRVFRRKTKVRESILYYREIFQNLNKTLKTIDKKTKLAVFGTNLFYHLFYTYTDLWKKKIILGIDDFPPNKKFPFKVVKPFTLEHECVDAILFCLNPIYIKIVLRRLGNKKYRYILPFKTKQ